MIKPLKSILFFSLILNLVLGFRFFQHKVFIWNYNKYEVINTEVNFEEAAIRFNEDFKSNELLKNKYIIFVDSILIKHITSKLYFLDSLACYNKNISFYVATTGDNDQVLDYLKKFNLEFSNLKFVSHLNYFHSSICNRYNSKVGVNGFDFVFNSQGKVLLDNFKHRKNNKSALLRTIDSIGKAEWRIRQEILK